MSTASTTGIMTIDDIMREMNEPNDLGKTP